MYVSIHHTETTSWLTAFQMVIEYQAEKVLVERLDNQL